MFSLRNNSHIISDALPKLADKDIQAAAIEMVKKVSKDAAYVLRRVFSDPGTVGPQLAAFLKQSDKDALVEKYTVKRKRKNLSNVELLAATVSVPLARSGYQKLKKLTDSRGVGFMSTWNYMSREKKIILPPSLVESEMVLSDTECMMPLFTIIKLTADRWFEVDKVKEKVSSLVTEVGADAVNPLHLNWFYKVRCDGTGGMSQYHQNGSDGKPVEDNKLFGNS